MVSLNLRGTPDLIFHMNLRIQKSLIFRVNCLLADNSYGISNP